MSITLAPEVLTVAGSVNAAIVIREGLTDQISTFPFWICVARNPAAGSIISNNYYKVSDLESLNNWMKDVLCCTPQEWTAEQQAQARANIGAMAAGIQKSLAINSTDDTAADVVLETELRESGTAAMQFYSGGADVGAEHHTILGGLADGENDTDAATVGQVKEMVSQSGGGTVKTVNGIAPDKNGNVEVETGGGSVGTDGYYNTTREEVGKAHEDINAAYIFSLYDALMETYPDRVQKKEHTNNDGTFTNYEYVISTGEYSTEGLYATAYGCDPHIKKPKYLVLNAIHGTERKTTLSTYRFVCDVLSGHNVPPAFREGVILSVMPVGTPSAFDAFLRQSGNAVDINRNFDVNWVEDTRKDENGNAFTYGASAASEKETQAIANWLADNTDAELFIDFHNSGQVNEKVVVMSLPDNTVSNTARKVALRGVDRVIPFWRDVIGYPTTVIANGLTDTDGDGNKVEERDVIFSYSASVEGNGMAFAYAQSKLGIRSIAIEAVSYYGDYYEWQENKTAYQPEVMAMGAEALGNILIEFYAQSCEVTSMANIENKVDTLIQIIDKGFRIESGTVVLETDVGDGTTAFMYNISCSNGAKMFTFCADDNTLEAVRANEGIKYMTSVLGNCFEPGVRNDNKQIRSLAERNTDMTSYGASYGWRITDSATTVDNTNGISFNCHALKAGTYHWKAYYWND